MDKKLCNSQDRTPATQPSSIQEVLNSQFHLMFLRKSVKNGLLLSQTLIAKLTRPSVISKSHVKMWPQKSSQ
jgi:hypothetical protein